MIVVFTLREVTQNLFRKRFSQCDLLRDSVQLTQFIFEYMLEKISTEVEREVECISSGEVGYRALNIQIT